MALLGCCGGLSVSLTLPCSLITARPCHLRIAEGSFRTSQRSCAHESSALPLRTVLVQTADSVRQGLQWPWRKRLLRNDNCYRSNKQLFKTGLILNNRKTKWRLCLGPWIQECLVSVAHFYLCSRKHKADSARGSYSWAATAEFRCLDKAVILLWDCNAQLRHVGQSVWYWTACLDQPLPLMPFNTL